MVLQMRLFALTKTLRAMIIVSGIVMQIAL